MDNLFFVTFLIGVLAMVLGFIKPAWVIRWGLAEDKTRGKAFQFTFLVSSISLVLGAFIFNPEVSSFDKFTGAYALVIIFSLLMLVIGLISPKFALYIGRRENRTRKRIAIIYSTIIFVFLFFISLFTPGTPFMERVSEMVAILFLYTFIAFIISIFKPQWTLFFVKQANQKRKWALLSYGSAAFVILIGLGFVTPSIETAQATDQVAEVVMEDEIEASDVWGDEEEAPVEGTSAKESDAKEQVENTASEKEAAEKAEAENTAAEKEAAEKAEAEKAAQEKEAAEKAEAEKAAQEKEAAEKAEAEKAAQEKEAAEKAEAEKAAQEKEAAEKADAEKAAQEKEAAEKAEAEKAAQEKEAAEKAEAEKAAQEKEAAEEAEGDSGFSLGNVFAAISNTVTQQKLKDAKEKEENRIKAQELYEQSLTQFENGDLVEVQKTLNQAIDLYDENGDAYVLRGYVTYRNMGFNQQFDTWASVFGSSQDLNLTSAGSLGETYAVIDQHIAVQKEAHKILTQIEREIKKVKSDFYKAKKLGSSTPEIDRLYKRMDQIDDFLDNLQTYHKTDKNIGKKLEDLFQTEEKINDLYANAGRHDMRNSFFHGIVDKYEGKLAGKLSEEREERKNFIGWLSKDDKEELTNQRESYISRINFLHTVVNLAVDTDDERMQELYGKQEDLSNDLTKLEEKKWKLHEEIRNNLDQDTLGFEQEPITIEGKTYPLGE